MSEFKAVVSVLPTSPHATSIKSICTSFSHCNSSKDSSVNFPQASQGQLGSFSFRFLWSFSSYLLSQVLWIRLKLWPFNQKLKSCFHLNSEHEAAIYFFLPRHAIEYGKLEQFWTKLSTFNWHQMMIRGLYFLFLSVWGIFRFLQFTLCSRRINITPVTFWCTHFLADHQPNQTLWGTVQLTLTAYSFDLFSLCSLPSFYFTGSIKCWTYQSVRTYFGASILLLHIKPSLKSSAQSTKQQGLVSCTWLEMAESPEQRTWEAQPGKWIMVYHLFWNRWS